MSATDPGENREYRRKPRPTKSAARSGKTNREKELGGKSGQIREQTVEDWVPPRRWYETCAARRRADVRPGGERIFADFDEGLKR